MALVSVFEYATVNYFISQSDKDMALIGRDMDRFFMFSAAPLWLVVVTLFVVYSTGTVITAIVLWALWVAVGFKDVVRALYYRFCAAARVVRDLLDEGGQALVIKRRHLIYMAWYLVSLCCGLM